MLSEPLTFFYILVPVKTNISLSRTTWPVGSDISIPCDVDGHPLPQVQWYKNKLPVEPSETLQISESHRLTIVRANHSDSGEYECVAENQYTRSSSSIRIMVEGNEKFTLSSLELIKHFQVFTFTRIARTTRSLPTAVLLSKRVIVRISTMQDSAADRVQKPDSYLRTVLILVSIRDNLRRVIL